MDKQKKETRRPLVVFGLLGTQLDMGEGPGRWEKWRPTVSLGQQEDLLIDRLEILCDERRFRKLAQRVVADLSAVSPETKVTLHDCYFDDPWDFEKVYAGLHDFAHAYPFDVENEDYLIHITTGTHVAQICWFLLAEARFVPARLLQTSPPRKQKEGATGSYSIIDLDLARYDQIAKRFAKVKAETNSFLKSGIQTRNLAFNQMIEQIERVAVRSKSPILLMGPTGAGKSSLAKNIYALKKQRGQFKGTFVEVNCATLRGDGASSALFGHVRGAFTGAQNERAGLLKSADGGMLFLDEIGELGADEQAMLLRAIEEKKFPPVGSDKEIHSDFQLIAGTNHDLATRVREGAFREDLFARLNLWTFDLPGLKQRSEDLEPNIDVELERFSNTHGERVNFNQEARRKYVRFAMSPQATWDGNFRDLSASITRLATLAPQGRIGTSQVDEEMARLRRLWGTTNNQHDTLADDFLQQVLGSRASEIDLFDAAGLRVVLDVCRRSRSLSDAGRTLFSASRQNKNSRNDADRLKKYLARFGLEFRALQGAATIATRELDNPAK
jgi:transcriptional regulatory protein RtcR